MQDSEYCFAWFFYIDPPQVESPSMQDAYPREDVICCYAAAAQTHFS